MTSIIVMQELAENWRTRRSRKAKVRRRSSRREFGKAYFDKTSGFRSSALEGRSRLTNLLSVPPQFWGFDESYKQVEGATMKTGLPGDSRL
jgi:hypothetical protein